MSISALNITLKSHSKAIMLIFPPKGALKLIFLAFLLHLGVRYRPWSGHGS